MNRLPFHRSIFKQGWPAALFFLLAAALPSAALAQKPPTAPPPAFGQKQMLAQDPRLDRVVSLDVISVPLGEVLQQESLDKSTEKMEDGHRFLLTAAPDCADLKLQIRLNARPLRTLMTALAEMLPGTWTRTPHGYQLSMTEQAADARAEWWRLFLGEREKALALQRKAVLAAMQTKAQRRKASDPDPEQSDLAVEEERANQHDFFYSLPPALKQQIAANMEESAFYEVGRISFGNGGEQFGTTGWLSQMSPQTQERFKGSLQTNADRLAQLPPTLQKYAVQAQKDVAALDPSRVYFWFQNAGVGVGATPVNGPPSVSIPLILDVPMTTGLPALTLDQVRLDQAVQKMGASAPDEWKRLAAYQRSRVWPNTLPKLPPEDQTTWHPTISRAAQTDWLGEQGHMEYVCDYYSHGGYSMPDEQKKLPVKRPLAKELDGMAAKRDVSWTEDADGIYLVRNNRWYRDDDLEVPEPLLRRWFGVLLQVRRQEAARQQETAPAATPATAPQATVQSPKERTAAIKQNWDWVAEVFSTLTPWQIRNGLSRFQPDEKDLSPQNDATAAKLYEKMKHYVPQPGEVSVPGTDHFAEAARMPPFWWAVNTLKGFPHPAQLYGSLGDEERAALLEGRLSPTSLGASQLTHAASLQPLLPQAMQSFPANSVRLGLLFRGSPSYHVVFMDVPELKLEVITPPQNAPMPPQNAPPPPIPGQ